MIWQHIRGHAEQIEMFRRSIRRGRLSHSYLFVGADGVGKKLFAKTLSQCLLCEHFADDQLESCGECPSCRQFAAETHPDFYLVGRPEGKSVVPIEVFVGADDRRGREGLCYEMSRRPMTGDRKIAVIDDADQMNQESANAFLKTLEEPPANSLIVLIATNQDAILPTIRSRCQLIRFNSLNPVDLSELLLELEIIADAAEAKTVAAMSDGSLATAAQLVDPALREIRESLYSRLSADKFDAVDLAAVTISAIDDLGGDSIAQRQSAVWMVRFCAEFYRRVLLSLSGSAETLPTSQVVRFLGRFRANSPEELEIIAEMVERTITAEEQLGRKVSTALCFESLFDDLGRMTRSVVSL